MAFNKNGTNNDDYVTDWTHCVNLNRRDIQFFLRSFGRRVRTTPYQFVSLRHRPLLKRLLEREPRIENRYDEYDRRYTFEEVVFFVSREGELIEDSFVKRPGSCRCEYCIGGELSYEELSEREKKQQDRIHDLGPKGESVFDVFRRIKRREIGAVVMAICDPSKFGDRWMVTIYHAPEDSEELVRWNREFSLYMADVSRQRQAHKAGRRRH